MSLTQKSLVPGAKGGFFYPSPDGVRMLNFAGVREQFPSVSIRADLRYGDRVTRTSDLFYSDEAHGRMPTVVYFPSNTFERLLRPPDPKLCAEIAQRGCAVFSVTLTPPGKGIAAYEMLWEAAGFLRWADAHAKMYRLDLDRLAFCGTGAGALFALWLTMACCSGRARDSVSFEAPCKPKGLALFSGLTDPKNMRMKHAWSVMDDSDRDHPGMEETFDPYRNHDLREMPKLFQAVKDTEAACSDARKLAQLFDTNGMENRLIVFPESNSVSELFAERTPLAQETVRSISAMLGMFWADPEYQ